MVGIGTALSDDPELTCRIAGLTRGRTVRIVADADARLPTHSKLVASARQRPVWVLCASDADAQRQAELTARGVRILHAARTGKGIDLTQGFAALAREGLTRVLVEGGAGLAAGLLKERLVDRVAWFRAAAVIGAEGLSAIGELNVAALSAMPRFKPVERLRLGDDVLETYEPAT
jgi:diaminohydroxyphosphoribosylaminopyrimidine deaminase/5-amino-6-(5-phosphoribosylamino)uracil reductase